MRVLKLETHIYAPELNKLHLVNGLVFNAPHCTTIKQAREKLFPKPFKGLHAKIESVYSESKNKWLDKLVANGKVKNRIEAFRFSKKFKQEGGQLLDGTFLESNKIKLTFIFN